MADRRGNLFAQLTRLFRSGPIVKRKIKSVDTRVARPDPTGMSSVLLLSKTQGVGFNASLNGQYGHQERQARLQDYNEMDAYALVNAALDIYADESVAQDANGKTLHIHSDNPAIKENLEELFYNTLNAEFNLRPWTRNLCKYGDFCLYIDVSPDYGVINVIPVPISSIAREEGYDPADPLAVRFRWTDMGNKVLENWEVAHFRLLGNDTFLPYGSSMVDGARRSWRQLVMVEDAMLVYRITRAVDRRVFYVDVGGVPPDEIGNYMEAAKMNIKSQGVVNKATGQMDHRYAPLPIRRDTPVPLLDGRTLTIEEMAKEHEAGKVNWVYSVQDDTLETVPGKVVWCGKNYTADRLARVWLDDGNYVDTAGEHPFVMRDGTHKRADELKPGEALMPLYKRMSKLGYEQCYNAATEKFIMTHAIVAKDVYPNAWANIPCRTVHHKGVGTPNNKLNNQPSNLQIMDFWVHRAWHAEHAMLTLNTPPRLEIKRERFIKMNATLEHSIRTTTRNKSLNLGKHMGDAYNGTALHKSHNVNRAEGQNRSWAENRQGRRDACKRQIPSYFIDVLREAILVNPNIGTKKANEVLMAHPTFLIDVKELGHEGRTNQNMSYWTWLAALNTMGYGTVVDGVIITKQERSKRLNETWSIFKRSVVENAAVSQEEQHVGYLNHKVDRVEWIEGDDVYCMTVVGSNGEEDRHNFAVNARKQDQTIATNSMILLRNSIEEDYWVATRGGETGTKIDTLPAGTNAAHVEDVEYIKKQLIAALKVPAAYLGYNDAIPGSSGLAQVDIRFSRTVNMIQRTIVSELNKIAMIHLYASGFRGEDLTSFEISLSNPSTIAQQQKLELLRSRFEIAGTMPMVGETPLMSERWLFRNVIGLNDQEILQVRRERLDDKRAAGALEAAGALAGDSDGEEGMPDAGADEDLGDAPAADVGGEAPAAGLETAADDNRGQGDVLTSVGGNGPRLREDDAPVKIAPHLKTALSNRRRNLKRRSNGFPKINDRAVSGDTAKPTAPNLREAFEDLYEDSNETMHGVAFDNKDEKRTSMSPVFGMVELHMLHGLAMQKGLEAPESNHWKKDGPSKMLTEAYKPRRVIHEADNVEEFELYVDEDGDKEPTT